MDNNIFFVETLKKCLFHTFHSCFLAAKKSLVIEHEVKHLPRLNANLNKPKLNNNLFLTTVLVSFPLKYTARQFYVSGDMLFYKMDWKSVDTR